MTAASASLQEKLNRWVTLTERKRELEAELRPVQDALTELEPGLLEDMALAGMKAATVNGMCIYQQREFYARPKEGMDRDTLIARLTAAGFGHCLQLGYQTLRGLAREWAEAGEEPPAGLRDCIDLGEVFRLRSRKSS